MSMARYLYKFNVNFKGVDFASIVNPPKPSYEILSDLEKASSLVAPPSILNEKTMACIILMQDLVGKKLQMTFDPEHLPKKYKNLILSEEATTFHGLDIERIFFPSGIYPLLDATKTIFLPLEDNWDQEYLKDWEEANESLSECLSLSMDIGQKRKLYPLSLGSISMKYSRVRVPLDGQSMNDTSLREICVDRENLNKTLVTNPGLWIECSNPLKGEDLACFEGEKELPFEVNPQGQFVSGRFGAKVKLLKKKGFRSEWPTNAHIAYESDDGNTIARIDFQGAPLKKVKDLLKKAYSDDLLLEMLQRSVPNVDLARTRWWLDLVDERSGRVKITSWDIPSPDKSLSFILEDNEYNDLIKRNTPHLQLLEEDLQSETSLIAIFSTDTFDCEMGNPAKVRLFQTDNNTFYLWISHEMTFLGENEYSIIFTMEKMLKGDLERAVEISQYWAQISFCALMGKKEVLLHPKRIQSYSILGSKLEGNGILYYDPSEPPYVDLVDIVLKELVIQTYQLETDGITRDFNLMQDPPALNALLSSLEKKLDIIFDEKTWGNIQTYNELKNTCDWFYPLQETGEEEKG